jgi:hypothetical protein
MVGAVVVSYGVFEEGVRTYYVYYNLELNRG